MTVIGFPRPPVSQTYVARPFKLDLSGMRLDMSGTLDGYMDFAIEDFGTYQLTCDDARRLAATLLSVVEDIQKNCRYDLDPLLESH